jgi:dimethylhistidine N-methyltransferase
MTPESLRRGRAAPDARLQPGAEVGHTVEEFRQDVLRGLQHGVRKISPKYFYDAEGARLFEEITRLDEYYPTRTETAILRAHVHEIAQRLGPGVRLVEFGSGSGEKTRLLLRALQQPASYVPVDIAGTQLAAFAADLRSELPHLDVQPVCADYTGDIPLPATGPRTAARDGDPPVAVFFPGSTIGNFEPLEAAAFLRRTARQFGQGARLVLGTDLHKSSAVLEAAYNDARGVTAAFNLNLLRRMQRELAAALELDAWHHHALYDDARHRIEMRLVADVDTRIVVPDSARRHTFEFPAGSWITTEYSHKYTDAQVRALAGETGWQIDDVWTDEREWFAVWLLTSTRRR